MAPLDNIGLIIVLVLIPLSTYLMVDFFRQKSSEQERIEDPEETDQLEDENRS